MQNKHRREFLKLSGLSLLPAWGLPFNISTSKDIPEDVAKEPVIKFFGDGEMYEPSEYITILQQVVGNTGIDPDRYGAGGAIEELEKRFEKITGKEKAVFLPTGTMANQLAISILSGAATKIFVQDTSHIYRDEADAAQSVFGKRLMPLAKDETYFTADTLQKAIESLKNEEVFSSGIGAVAIENPVRRAHGCMVPLDEIRKISTYCREHNLKLHLDGARIYMASAWSGTGIKEYASFFDTVYISLYKYLGAAGGAMLCGDKNIIEQLPHLQKIHGGTMFGNWANAAMALHKLENIESSLQQVIQRSTSLFAALNKEKGITITALNDGTNIYELKLPDGINGKKFQSNMMDKWKIRMGFPGADYKVFITVNETLLYRDEAYIVNAFRQSINA